MKIIRCIAATSTYLWALYTDRAQNIAKTLVPWAYPGLTLGCKQGVNEVEFLANVWPFQQTVEGWSVLRYLCTK